jgi:hypothetical protein
MDDNTEIKMFDLLNAFNMYYNTKHNKKGNLFTGINAYNNHSTNNKLIIFQQEAKKYNELNFDDKKVLEECDDVEYHKLIINEKTYYSKTLLALLIKITQMGAYSNDWLLT